MNEVLILKELQEIKEFAALAAKTALSVEEAEVFTNLSKSTIYKLCHLKKIPHWKGAGGKYTFFRKDELEKWMLHRRVKTTDELETEAANYIVTGNVKRGRRK